MVDFMQGLIFLAWFYVGLCCLISSMLVSQMPRMDTTFCQSIASMNFDASLQHISSLKLTVRTSKWIGRFAFPFGNAHFQMLCWF